MLDREFYVMLLKLLIFLPLILLLIYLFGKIAGNKFQYNQSGKKMKIIERLQISKENCLLIVKIYDKAYVVSSTSERIKVLLELDNADIIEINDKKNDVEIKNIKDIFEKLKSKKEDLNE